MNFSRAQIYPTCPEKEAEKNIYPDSYTNILVVKKGVSTLRSALLWLLVPLDIQIYFFLS